MSAREAVTLSDGRENTGEKIQFYAADAYTGYGQGSADREEREERRLRLYRFSFGPE